MRSVDPDDERVTFGDRLREANISPKRFIDVHDGEKRSTDHTQREPNDPRLQGNYGVYGGRGADRNGHWLVNVDIDESDDSVSTDGLDALPPTFTIESPHTDGEEDGHRYYAVRGDVDAVFDERLGIKNPAPEWGEVRVANQYCVGPGSQLNGCDKEWCDECAKRHGGYYRIADDRPIAILGLEEFVEAIITDLPDDWDRADKGDDVAHACGGYARDIKPGPGLPDDVAVDERLEHALETDDKLRRLWNGRFRVAGYGDDRSKAESALAAKLGWWFGQCPGTVRHLMNRANTQKWCNRPDSSYRDSVLSTVGGEEYYTPIRELAGGSAPVAVLPNLPQAQASANAWNWETVDMDAGHVPSQTEVYNRVTEVLIDAMRRQDQIVVDAIMGGGKTFNTFAAALERDEPVAYVTARRELYDQAVDYALENGYARDEIFILPTAFRDCPTFKGEYGQEWRDRVSALYARGANPKAIHNMLSEELPCCSDGDAECPYEERCKIDPDDYEIVIGHYKHAHLPHATGGRHCVFDENPTDTFTTRIAGTQLIEGVNAFLALDESPPFATFNDLVENRHSDEERRRKALGWFNDFDFEPDEQNVVRFEDKRYHAYAPHAVYTILEAEPVDEDSYPFEKASLPGLDNEGLFFTTDDQYGQYFVELQTPPELTYSRSVIALDGTPLLDPESDDKHPTPSEWEKALGRPMNYRQVLTDEERAAFLEHTQGHTYVQTSPHIRPYSSGKWNDKQRDAALLATVTEEYGGGDPPLVLTSKSVRSEYEEEFIDAGIAEAFDHSNNIRGSNEYATCRFAVQLGSSHHGDHELMRRAAWLDETVEPEGKGADRDYGAVGNEILEQMRECQVAQNVLRVGRDGRGALIVLDTSAFPDWLPVDDEIGDVSLWSPAERQVRDAVGAIREDGGQCSTTAGLSTTEIADHPAVDVNERSVRRACRRHADRGLLEGRSDPDDGRRTRWVDLGLGDLDTTGAAEVDLPEVAVDDSEVPDKSRIEVHTRTDRNSDGDQSRAGAPPVSPGGGPSTGGTPPPDEVD